MKLLALAIWSEALYTYYVNYFPFYGYISFNKYSCHITHIGKKLLPVLAYRYTFGVCMCQNKYVSKVADIPYIWQKYICDVSAYMYLCHWLEACDQKHCTHKMIPTMSNHDCIGPHAKSAKHIAEFCWYVLSN